MMLIVHAILLDGFQAEWVEVGAVGGLDLDKPWRLIREFCEAEGLDYLDTGPPLEAFRETTGERYCWRYDAHWNEHGHRVAAEALFQYLAKTLGNE
jgi:hypothetical protein